MYRAELSRHPAVEVCQNFIRERIKKFFWNFDFSLIQADRTIFLCHGRYRPDLRNGDVALAHYHGLAAGDFSQIFRKIRFGVVNIDLQHPDYIVD